jgi:hypothetical protein
MENQQKVLLYGNSLVLSGIEAGLKTCPGLELISLANPVPEKELLEVNASVVIFDLGGVESEFLLTQMQALPESLLIGVDPETHEVLLTGQAACSITLDQITHFVRGWLLSGASHPLPPTAATE